MTASQQFSLRWNNYSQHIVTALEDLRSDDELTDVTLSCDGERIKAHKILLSACSTYFRDTFRDNPCKHPVIILKGVNFADLQSVVTFMYNGQVNVSQERLQTFLQTAELLQIKGLTDVNEKEDNAKKRSHGGNGGPLSSQSQPSNQDSNSRSATPDNPQRPPTPKRKRMTVGGFNEGASSSAGSASFNSSTIPIQPIVIGTSGSNGSVAGPSSSGGGLLNPQSVVIPSTSSSSQAAQPLEEEGFHDVSVVKYEDEDIVEDEDYDEKHMSSEDNENSAQDMLCNVESGSLGVFSGGVRTGISASGVDSSTHGSSQRNLRNRAPIQKSSIRITSTTSATPITGMFRRAPHHIEIPGGNNDEFEGEMDEDEVEFEDGVDLDDCEDGFDMGNESDDGIRVLEVSSRGSKVGGTNLMSRVGGGFTTTPTSGSAVQRSQQRLEAPYKCEICGKAYVHSCTLVQHRKVHQGATQCRICSQTLSNVSNLRAHYSTVHGKSPREVAGRFVFEIQNDESTFY